ncbi:type II secretion system protein GspL [Sphingomonas sp. VNH70]|uniref:type II secretion system protein GspL n=1 Tax=Sphingomonas silueang TaxID=3156617 RepID=UPI0032B42939
MTIEPAPAGPAAGVWAVAGGEAILVDAAGPATLLVPSEAVLLLIADLPLPSAAKRLAALPFAVEDRIADPLEAVHLALGQAVGDRRYLVAVVRHGVMAQWIAIAGAAGIGGARFVPDSLALSAPVEGWSVELTGARALVRAADGTGFALPAPMLVAAWEAAGRPPVQATGDPLPDAMAGQGSAFPPAPLAERVAAAPIDLRQGLHARRRGPLPSVARKVAMILGLAALAHGVIAVADTLMLQRIAGRRQAALQQLVATTAPNVPTGGDDFATRVADLLPRATGTNRFVPLLSRVGQALTPIGPVLVVRSMNFEGNVLTIDAESPETGMADRIRAALTGAGIAGEVATAPGGGLRITARGA